MKHAIYIALARREFLAEVAFYNKAQTGLGRRFISAIEQACARALAFPEAGSPIMGDIRRVIVSGFPFSVVYRPTSDGILIFAIAHHSREPQYWQTRIPIN